MAGRSVQDTGARPTKGAVTSLGSSSVSKGSQRADGQTVSRSAPSPVLQTRAKRVTPAIVFARDPAIQAAEAAARNAGASPSVQAPAAAIEPVRTTATQEAAPANLESASLLLGVQSGVRAGTLTLFVDGREVYSRRLQAASQEGKKFWRKVFTPNTENFKATIEIPSGKHEVRVIVVTDGVAEGFEQRTVIDAVPGTSRKFRVQAGKDETHPLLIDVD